MWLLVVVTIRLNLVEMYPLHVITMNYLVAGAVLFSVGGALAFFVPKTLIAARFGLGLALDKHSTNNNRSERSVKRIEFLVIAVLAIALGCQMLNMIHVASQGVGDGLMRRAQSVAEQNMLNGIESRSIFDYVPLIAVYIAILFLLEHRGRAFWGVFLLAFASCVVRGGRGALLILISSLVGAHLMDIKNERFLPALKAARWAVVSFLILFMILLLKEKDVSSVQISLTKFAADAVVQYAIGPAGAFDLILTHPSYFVGLPHHTFKMFLRVASWFGIISYTPHNFNEWAFVPFGTNVYTIYKPFIADFGLYGALGAVAVIAFMHTLLFRRAHLGGRLAQYMFALSVYPIFMVIFDDVYTAFALYINAMLFGILYFTAQRYRWSVT
jgi:oligosaccharide repeat unit polymerase